MRDSTRPGTGTSTPQSCPRFARQWAEVLTELRASVGARQFDTWFRSIQGVRLRDSVLELELPNEHYRKWMKSNFADLLEREARRALGPGTNVVLKAPDSHSEREQPSRDDEHPVVSSPLTTLVEARGPYAPLYHRWVDKLLPELGLPAWGVYLVLLRFVWRETTHIEALQERVERGELVAHVSSKKIAHILGLSFRKVRSCLRELERVAVIQTVQVSGGSSLYVLGHRSVDSDERWFADLLFLNP